MAMAQLSGDKRHIILTPGEPPRLEGGWTVGEIQQMAQLLMEWLSQLQVSQPQTANSATANDTDG